MFPLIKLLGEVFTLALFFTARPEDRRRHSTPATRR